LGLESAKGQGIDGRHVSDRFCAGCPQEIADYCMRDVELVRLAYYRMVFPGGIRTGKPDVHRIDVTGKSADATG
jgi:hypothetical protein